MLEAYKISIEHGAANLPELQPLYAMHYAETEERLRREGFNPAPYKPDWGRYCEYWSMGYLVNYCAREKKTNAPVGYANVYFTTSMHTQEPIAHEDMLWVHPDHRKGLGRAITKFVLEDCKRRGVRRAVMTARTDPRAEALWKRLGFIETAREMVKEFD